MKAEGTLRLLGLLLALSGIGVLANGGLFAGSETRRVSGGETLAGERHARRVYLAPSAGAAGVCAGLMLSLLAQRRRLS